MAETPKTIRVTNDYVADELSRLGNAILDLSMKMRDGFDVPVTYESERCPQPCEHLSQQDAREGKACEEHPCSCGSRHGKIADAIMRNEGVDTGKRVVGPGGISVPVRALILRALRMAESGGSA